MKRGLALTVPLHTSRERSDSGDRQSVHAHEGLGSAFKHGVHSLAGELTRDIFQFFDDRLVHG